MLRYVVVPVTGTCYTFYFVTLFQAVDSLIYANRLYSYQLFLAKPVKLFCSSMHFLRIVSTYLYLPLSFGMSMIDLVPG